MKEDIESTMQHQVARLNEAISDMPSRADEFKEELGSAKHVLQAPHEENTKNFPEVKPVKVKLPATVK